MTVDNVPHDDPYRREREEKRPRTMAVCRFTTSDGLPAAKHAAFDSKTEAETWLKSEGYTFSEVSGDWHKPAEDIWGTLLAEVFDVVTVENSDTPSTEALIALVEARIVYMDERIEDARRQLQALTASRSRLVEHRSELAGRVSRQ